MDLNKKFSSIPSVDPEIQKLLFKEVELSKERFLIRLENHIVNLKKLQQRIIYCQVKERYVYKYYNYSHKIYDLQSYTKEIVELLQKLSDRSLCSNFMRMVEAGTGMQCKKGETIDWYEETCTIMNAFFHANYMLDSIILCYDVLQDMVHSNKYHYCWLCILRLYELN